MTQTKSIEEREQEIIDAFMMLDGDLEMSNIYLIERGKKLDAFPEDFRRDENLVKGCQSKVWLVAVEKDGRVYYKADSNTAITKGLVSLLVFVLSGQPFDDIMNSKLNFIQEAGLSRFIGTQRSNGLLAMIKQMKIYALAFKNKLAE